MNEFNSNALLSPARSFKKKLVTGRQFAHLGSVAFYLGIVEGRWREHEAEAGERTGGRKCGREEGTGQ